MKVSELLALARQEMEEADLPNDLRVAAFEKAVDLLSKGHTAKPAAQDEEAGKSDAQKGAIGDGLLAKVAAKLSRSPQDVAQVFYEDGEEIGLSVASTALDKKKKAGTRQVAVLVAAARQASGIDNDGWTDSGVVREACEHYGKYDQANFAATLAGMDDVFVVKKDGQSRKVKVKVKVPGFERAAALVDEFSGSGAS